MKIVRDYMGEAHLKAVIVRVTVDGKEIVTAAEGESMTGVPAATDMHFRNGAVAISYVSTLLLKLVDERKISLGDKLSKYLPDMPHADEITIHQLALKNTRPNLTAQIPEPALHAFSSERRGFFNIAAGEPFYEESTYWNPSWTINHGAIQTSNIYDLERSAVAIGTGELISDESYKLMTTTDLCGKTSPVPGCGNCRELDNFATYGLGLWISGNWYFQNPLFFGYAAVNAYLPSEKIAIAVAVTYLPGAFNDEGLYSNGGDALFRKIGAYLAPNDAPPTRTGS